MAAATAPASPSTSRGAEWLLRSTEPDASFTPEQLTEEHRLIGRTAAEFVSNEVLPQLDRLEQKDWDLARRLVRRAGDLGLLGVDIAACYGGVGCDTVASVIISERLALSDSFGVTFGAQSTLTAIALFLFGTDAQKQKYLPKLLSGEIIGAFGLTETESGSDALGAHTKAARQPDGSFVLNGEKMWITNGGFADLFIVFAKIGGERLTAFLVERSAGVKSGPEEHKMGLLGSSTTSLILQDVGVPAENVLGGVGRGHKVAFGAISFARFKLGASCEGSAQGVIGESAKYAAERRQFGQPIASFGAIKHKIGEMVVRTYAVESLLYRIAGLVDRQIAATPHDDNDGSAVLAAFEEYAIEASIAKVASSEVLDFVVDENLQIHGGNGYVQDFPAERHYRDARVNRIFEGTNEINRLLIAGTLARRAVKGELAVIAAATALQDELLGPPAPPGMDEGLVADERRAVELLKKSALMVIGVALDTYGRKLGDQQEVVFHIADILMDVFAAESAVLRAVAASNRNVIRASLHVDAARVFVNDAAMRIEASAKQALAAMVEGDVLRTMLAALRRLSKTLPINTAALRRRLADETVSRGGYPFAN